MVSLLYVTAGDVETDFMHHLGPGKRFNWPQNCDSCYVSVKSIVQKISTRTTSTLRCEINGGSMGTF